MIIHKRICLWITSKYQRREEMILYVTIQTSPPRHRAEAALRFNRHVTNRLLSGLATRLPGFGLVLHTGRRSRRRYRTPVNVFRTPNGYLFALTYGSGAEWVKNVVAAKGCELVTRGRTERLVNPRVFRDDRRGRVPVHIRAGLRLGDVSEFLELDRDPAPPGPIDGNLTQWM